MLATSLLEISGYPASCLIPPTIQQHPDLYAYGWVNFADTCADLVDALLQLSPGKRPFYQRGQRAMSLIRSTL